MYVDKRRKIYKDLMKRGVRGNVLFSIILKMPFTMKTAQSLTAGPPKCNNGDLKVYFLYIDLNKFNP